MEKQEKKTETKRGGAQPKDEAKASAKVVEAGKKLKEDMDKLERDARRLLALPLETGWSMAADLPAIVVVFSLEQCVSEFHGDGRWGVEGGEGTPANDVHGTDAMMLMTEDEAGYVSLKRPK